MRPSAFQYAIVRVVPQVERGECLNAGVALFCRSLGFLAARVELDEARLRALAPASTSTRCAVTSTRSSGSPTARQAPARSRLCRPPSASAG